MFYRTDVTLRGYGAPELVLLAQPVEADSPAQAREATVSLALSLFPEGTDDVREHLQVTLFARERPGAEAAEGRAVPVARLSARERDEAGRWVCVDDPARYLLYAPAGGGFLATAVCVHSDWFMRSGLLYCETCLDSSHPGNPALGGGYHRQRCPHRALGISACSIHIGPALVRALLIEGERAGEDLALPQCCGLSARGLRLLFDKEVLEQIRSEPEANALLPGLELLDLSAFQGAREEGFLFHFDSVPGAARERLTRLLHALTDGGVLEGHPVHSQGLNTWYLEWGGFALLAGSFGRSLYEARARAGLLEDGRIDYLLGDFAGQGGRLTCELRAFTRGSGLVRLRFLPGGSPEAADKLVQFLRLFAMSGLFGCQVSEFPEETFHWKGWLLSTDGLALLVPYFENLGPQWERLRPHVDPQSAGGEVGQ
jgi:hypothetical protein